jgi:hypothetical protein
MGAAIAHEHAGITKLADNLRKMLQCVPAAHSSLSVELVSPHTHTHTHDTSCRDIEGKVLAEMQAKTSLEAQLRLEFGQLLDENIGRWRDEEHKHRDDYETELRRAWEGMEARWAELTSLFQGERALETSDEWRPYVPYEIPVPPAANPTAAGTGLDLPPAILLAARNSAYLPRQEGQSIVAAQPSAKAAQQGGLRKRGPEITHIFVWERAGHVNLLYDDFAASLHPIQEGDGQRRKPNTPQPAGRTDYTLLPDRNASRGHHYYSHLMMMPQLGAPALSTTAFATPPIAFLPIGERGLAIIHGTTRAFCCQCVRTTEALTDSMLCLQVPTGTTAWW